MAQYTTSKLIESIEKGEAPEIKAFALSPEEIEKNFKNPNVNTAKAASYHNVVIDGKTLYLTVVGNIRSTSHNNKHTDGKEEYRKPKPDNISKCEFSISGLPEKHNDDKGATEYISIIEAINTALTEQIEEATKAKAVNTKNSSISPLINTVYGDKTNEKDENGKSMKGKPLKSGPFITHDITLLDKHDVNPSKIPTTKIYDVKTATVDEKGITHFKELTVNGEHINGNNFKEVFNWKAIIKYMKVKFQVIQSPQGTSINVWVQEMAIEKGESTARDGVDLGTEYTEEMRKIQEQASKMSVSSSSSSSSSAAPTIVDASINVNDLDKM
jgi:hypothetical protein